MTKETDIVFDQDGFWVAKDRTCYAVYRPSPSGTHILLDSAYEPTPDGFSLARARATYLASRAVLL